MRDKIITIIRMTSNEELAADKIIELFNPKSVISPSNFESIINHLNLITKKKYRGNESLKKKYRARLKEGFTLQDFIKAINNASKDQFHRENGYKYLTPEFFSRPDKLDKFINSGDGLPIEHKPKSDIAETF